MTLWLYVLQRGSAILMIPLVLGHLATMIYAIQGGLSAAEILARTQGSEGWLLFYGLFVLAAAIHAAIGLRTIAGEWAGLRDPWQSVLGGGVALALLIMGWRAVWAVYAGGSA